MGFSLANRERKAPQEQSGGVPGPGTGTFPSRDVGRCYPSHSLPFPMDSCASGSLCPSRTLPEHSQGTALRAQRLLGDTIEDSRWEMGHLWEQRWGRANPESRATPSPASDLSLGTPRAKSMGTSVMLPAMLQPCHSQWLKSPSSRSASPRGCRNSQSASLGWETQPQAGIPIPRAPLWGGKPNHR